MNIQEEKVKRLARWRQAESAGPVTLELNPTNRCNLKCISCWQREFDFDRNDRISDERMLSIVREGAELGVAELRIPGAGEPLMRPNMIEVMKLAKELGMSGLLITNGTLLTENFMQKLVEINWDTITFSIDSAEQKTQDYLRGVRGTYRSIIRNLKFLDEIKKKKETGKPMLGVNTVLSKYNYKSLPEMAEFLYKTGCTDWQVQALTVWGNTGKMLELNREEIKELPKYVSQALKICRSRQIPTNLLSFLLTDIAETAGCDMDRMIDRQTKNIRDRFLSLPCFEPFYNIIILPDGRASFCSMAGGRDGEIILEKNIADVWHGNAYNKIRKRLLEKNLPDYCRKCCSAVNLENERIRKLLMKSLHSCNPEIM